MQNLLKLILVLGPKIKEALPLILQIIEMFVPQQQRARPSDSATAASEFAPLSGDSRRAYQAMVDEGASEEEAQALVRYVERKES